MTIQRVNDSIVVIGGRDGWLCDGGFSFNAEGYMIDRNGKIVNLQEYIDALYVLVRKIYDHRDSVAYHHTKLLYLSGFPEKFITDEQLFTEKFRTDEQLFNRYCTHLYAHNRAVRGYEISMFECTHMLQAVCDGMQLDSHDFSIIVREVCDLFNSEEVSSLRGSSSHRHKTLFRKIIRLFEAGKEYDDIDMYVETKEEEEMFNDIKEWHACKPNFSDLVLHVKESNGVPNSVAEKVFGCDDLSRCIAQFF